jgi:penicillin-binding protein 1A
MPDTPRRLRSLALRLLVGLAAFALAGFALFVGYIVVLLPATPDIADIRRTRVERPSVLLSADGQTLARFQRINRQWVRLDQVAQPVIDALIATEDRRFHAHRGVDLRRSALAAVKSLGGERQGGSTITQQLARNLFPEQIGRAPTLTRKLKEAITALKLEHAYSKREILETYLNTVPFLYNANGIEMAARTYFDTTAARLTPAQGATLIAMLKGPAAYNPMRNPERALARRNLVLAQMVAQGSLPRADFEALRRRPLELSFAPQEATGPAPHFADQARRALTEWAAREGYDLDADGLVIQTSIDSRLQRLAVEAVARQLDALQAVADVEWARPSRRLLSTRVGAYAEARRRLPAFAHFWDSRPALLDVFVRESPEFARLVAAGHGQAEALARLRADGEFMARLKAAKTRLEAGFVALDPDSGEVRAWVGSRDYAIDAYDHVAQARRQPGSTFKPFAYAAALEAGIPAYREFIDEPVAIRLADGNWWQPGDVAGASGEIMSLQDGLVYSKNSITGQVVAEIGAPRIAELARRAGVRASRLDPVPSLALGTSPVTLLEMAAGYATLARQGQYRAPTLVTRVSDRHGRLLAQFRPAPEPALSRDIAGQLIEMLRGAVERGTGRGLRQRFGITADVAGKTGTTQDHADGWFMLMHPQLLAGAWVGFNDPRVQMRSDYWGQGAHTALFVVGDFFRGALAAGAVDAAARFPSWSPPVPLLLAQVGADTEAAEGTEATKGVDGTQGTPGVEGTQGSEGVEGTQGTGGTDGAEGVEGTPGDEAEAVPPPSRPASSVEIRWSAPPPAAHPVPPPASSGSPPAAAGPWLDGGQAEPPAGAAESAAQ